MKTLTSLYTLLLLFSWPTQAQVPVAADTPLVNQFIDDHYAQRSPAWWNALGRQLTLLLDKPVEQVDVAALQNVIYFATHHRDKVLLNDASPKLMAIYLEHEQAATRTMALAALHAIGDAEAMAKLRRHVPTEQNAWLKRRTIAALNDHYRSQ